MISEHMHSTAISQGLYEQSTLPDNVEEDTVIYNGRPEAQESLSQAASLS